MSFTDGTSRAFATRERPHLVFADEKRTTPMGVITAVSSQPVGPGCDTCTEKACSQCKITNGRDWTWTQFEPFANFKEPKTAQTLKLKSDDVDAAAIGRGGAKLLLALSCLPSLVLGLNNGAVLQPPLGWQVHKDLAVVLLLFT